MASSSSPPPVHQPVFRDLTPVDSESLERTVDRLGRAVMSLRQKSTVESHLLLDGIADCEAELISREIDRGRSIATNDPPSLDVVRVAHGTLIQGAQ